MWLSIGGINSQNKCATPGLSMAQPSVMWRFFLKTSTFLLDLKNRKFCLDMPFPSTSVYFSGPAGGRLLRARVPHMARRMFCRRVIPWPGGLDEVVAKIVFVCGGCSSVSFSKSVDSFRPTVFCPCFSRMWLSIGGVNSQNKCVTPELGMGKTSVMRRKNWKFWFFDEAQ